MTKVTVLMTVYNGMPHLEKAVHSVLTQTLCDFRFVIVDDGSVDGTADFLASIEDERVTVLSQPNGGTAKAANLGLGEIDTTYVARMDADDIAHPNRLQRQLDHMEAHPEIGILGAQVRPIGKSGTGKSLNLPLKHEEIFSAMIKGRHGLAHSVIMIRTEILKQLGGYWQFPLIDDWDMMLRVGEQAQLVNLPDVLLEYRVHQESLNGQSMLKMHRHISYAIHRAKNRQKGQEQISYEDFLELMASRPFWQRSLEWMHIHAMTNYRVAIADIHGGKPLSGYARLAYSSLCSPARTIQRLRRNLTVPKSGDPNVSDAPVSEYTPNHAQTPV